MPDCIPRALVWVLTLLLLTRRTRPGRRTALYYATRGIDLPHTYVSAFQGTAR
ncbi:hypothetical protein ACWF94_31635 [Streptomyces sp. NPDC055078]